MKKEIRTVVYDDELHIEAYRFARFSTPVYLLNIVYLGLNNDCNICVDFERIANDSFCYWYTVAILGLFLSEYNGKEITKRRI